MRRNKFRGANIGTSSILIIIVTLTLICFGGLSLASASADYRLCQKLADRTSAYYEATSRAYTLMAEEAEKKLGTESSFSTNITLNEYQELQVEATINPRNAEGDKYIIDRFLVVTVNEPQIDDKLSLLMPQN